MKLADEIISAVVSLALFKMFFTFSKESLYTSASAPMSSPKTIFALTVKSPLAMAARLCPMALKEREAPFETKKAIEDGAEEIDMVINIGALKNKDYETVKEDIKAVVEAAGDKAIVKVIIETCLLTDEEKVKACELAKESGAHYVKTSTGFSKAGAKVEDVKLMKKVIGEDMKVKASGGIRDYETAKAMIEAGASRIGASSSVKIIQEASN